MELEDAKFTREKGVSRKEVEECYEGKSKKKCIWITKGSLIDAMG